MDISTGASAERLRVGSGVGRRVPSLLGESNFAASGYGFAGSGGLLETFDTVFRSTVNSLPPAIGDGTSEELASGVADVDSPERLESKSSESSHSSSSESIEASEDAGGEGEVTAVAVNGLVADGALEDVKSEGDAGLDEAVKEITAELEVVAEEELESRGDAELASVEAGALLSLAAVANQQAQPASENAAIQGLSESGDAAVAVEFVEEELQNLRGQEATEQVEARWIGTGAREETDNSAAGQKEPSTEDVILVAGGKGEHQGNDRGRRVGARYSDKKEGPQGINDRSSSPVLENGESRVAVQGVPDELMQEMRAVELGESLEVPQELQAAPLEVPQATTVLDRVAAIDSATIAASAVQSSASGVGSGASDAGQADSFSTEGRVGGAEGTAKRDEGLRGATGEGKGVQGGSNEAQVRLVQRVSRAFQRLGPDGGRVNIMLHPAELGSVKLELQIEGHAMRARMTAESETAASLLRESLPELKQKLAEAGMVVQSIDLQVADQQTSGSGGNGLPFGGWDQSQQGRGQDGRSGRPVRGERGTERVAERAAEKAVVQGRVAGRSLARGPLDLRL